jgi:SAM-dependent methyltransferase
LPLSYRVEDICGVDNESAIKRIREKSKGLDNISTVVGNFLDLDPSALGLYSKILIYSVIHYLASDDELIQFLSKALKLLAPGGRMLIGDIPNSNKKLRYEQSPLGLSQVEAWKHKVSNTRPTNLGLSADSDLIVINDDCYLHILKFARSQGFESYLLPEPENLPFGRTRDDILIIAHQ